MRCSDPSRHRHHQLSLARGEDNGLHSLQVSHSIFPSGAPLTLLSPQQRKEFSQDRLQSSCQYQTSVFQDNRISPDVIPESFSQLSKCQELPVSLGTNRPARPSEDSDSSSGFSEKVASSELSCSDYYAGGETVSAQSQSNNSNLQRRDLRPPSCTARHLVLVITRETLENKLGKFSHQNLR